jgi:hypothetical protein
MGALLAGLFSKNMLPIILGGVAGLALLIGALVLYEKGKHACEAGQAAAIMKAQQRADALANELVIAQAQAMAATDQKAVTIVQQIKMAPDDQRRLCAVFNGVRDITSGRDPKALSCADDAVPAARTAPGGRP